MINKQGRKTHYKYVASYLRDLKINIINNLVMFNIMYDHFLSTKLNLFKFTLLKW